MSLQNKVVLLIFCVFFILALLIYQAQSMFIIPSYESLEKEEALEDLERGINQFEAEVKNVALSNTDWTAWDDFDKFMQDGNKEFVTGNLMASALHNLKINLLYAYNNSRELVWGMMYDYEHDKEIAIPELVKALEGSRLIPQADPNSQQKGFLNTSLGPMIIVAGPIRKSSGEGPAHGTLLFGRFINAKAIAEGARIDLNLTPISGNTLDPEKASIVAELDNTGKPLIQSKKSCNIVCKTLNDILEKPALLVQVTVPRTISNRGQMAVRFTTLSLFSAGAVILFVLIMSLRRMMLKPLKLLTDHVLEVGRSENLAHPLALSRGDELGALAKEFNTTIARLAETRKALIDQSYHAGVAEMARGVLHNIGNAITPIRTKLSVIMENFSKAPVADMEIAAEELGKGSTDSERRDDLSKFMELAGIELTGLIKETGRELQEVNRHVEHIQKILADQHRFSTAQRVIESIDPAAVINESIRLLPERLSASIEIEPAPDLTGLPNVLSGRIALHQVLNNLLINACEAIIERESGPDGGRIGISGALESVEGAPMVHLKISDNGIGIAPEQMKKLFERDFSTKDRGSGLGLHWSANTISALKGRLYAESEGSGMGAVFHIFLPIVNQSKNKEDKL